MHLNIQKIRQFSKIKFLNYFFFQNFRKYGKKCFSPKKSFPKNLIVLTKKSKILRKNVFFVQKKIENQKIFKKIFFFQKQEKT